VVINFTRHKGGNRAAVEYTFASGHIEPKRISNAGVDESAALTAAINNIPNVEGSISGLDAEKAEHNDSDIVATGEASMQQVARQYLKRAMREDDPIIAFSKLDKFNTFRNNQGWTAAQVKAQLNLNDDQWNKITTRYSYLLASQQVLIDYQTVVSGDTVRDE